MSFTKAGSPLAPATALDANDTTMVSEDGTLVEATLAQVVVGGGGALDADLDAHMAAAAPHSGHAATATQIIAGAGLTGGGTLAADRTLNVVAHADGSIVVAADSVQVGVISDAQHGTRGGGTTHAAAVELPAAAGFLSEDEADALFLRRKVWRTHCDFEPAAITQTPFTASVTGASANVTIPTTVYDNHIGVYSFTTGTTATGRAAVNLRPAELLQLGGGRVRFAWVHQVVTLSTLAEEFALWGGLNNAFAAEPTDGFYFLYDRLNRGDNWIAVSAEDGVYTRTDTGIPVVAGQWYHLYAVCNATATSIEYYIDGALVATITTNIADTSDPLGVSVSMLKSAGTTARTSLIDYFAAEKVFTTPR